MKRWELLPVLLVVACLTGTAAISGTFRGVIVHAPDGETSQRWIYVQGRNGNLRRAEVSHARVLYAGSVPLRLRAKDPAKGLKEGAEVRVTASQDGDGEWRASRVEILKAGAMLRRNRPQARPAAKRTSRASNAAL